MTDITDKIKKDKIEFIELQFTDIFGTLKSIELPSDCLEDAIKRGVWFDGSSIKGFARLKESDMFLKPDLETYAILPFDDQDKKTARFFCDVYTPDGEIFDGSPRSVLKRMIDKAREMDFEFKVGPEIEFYLFKKNENGKIITPNYDTGSYFDSSVGDIGSDIRKEIMTAIKSVGIEPERGHHEVGIGQHEIGFKYGDALVTADRTITLKKIIKSIAHKHDLIASFIPKPFFQKPGSGMHVHFSLFDKKGNPLFYEGEDKHKLSPLAKHFIAGILGHTKEISAILNPTINSYKRLVKGYEAPVYICWGSKNRSALIRVPRYTKGRESSVRAEIRSPDASSSPYLVFSAILKAGLEGIIEKTRLNEEADDNVYTKTRQEIEKEEIGLLPNSLDEAIKYFKKSDLMKEMLGETLFNNYIDAKEKECEEYRTNVTGWELIRYLNC